jgi:hypothetical protein
MVAAVTRRIQRQVREKRDAVQAEMDARMKKEGPGLAPLEAKECAERKMDKYFTDYVIEVDQEEGPTVEQVRAYVVHLFTTRERHSSVTVGRTGQGPHRPTDDESCEPTATWTAIDGRGSVWGGRH